MNNPPSKEELIISIINFLENDIISELKGQKRFHAHVAKNSLNIVLRQLRLEKENNSKEKKRLKEILKILGKNLAHAGDYRMRKITSPDVFKIKHDHDVINLKHNDKVEIVHESDIKKSNVAAYFNMYN